MHTIPASPSEKSRYNEIRCILEGGASCRKWKVSPRRTRWNKPSLIIRGPRMLSEPRDLPLFLPESKFLGSPVPSQGVVLSQMICMTLDFTGSLGAREFAGMGRRRRIEHPRLRFAYSYHPDLLSPPPCDTYDTLAISD